MANPGASVGSGALITPGGAQGPQGAAGGSGSPGSPGPAGANAWTLSAAGMTVPAVGSTVSVAVNDASWVAVGETIYVLGAAADGTAAALVVQSKAGNTLTLLNPVISTLALANTGAPGLLAQTSGVSSDYAGGDNAFHTLGPIIVGGAAGVAAPSTGIVVPRYAAHPDAAWAYGTYDDHFDAGTLNAKWTQTIGSGGSITVSDSMVNLLSVSNVTSITQGLPAASDFTITFKVRYAGFVPNTAGILSGVLFSIYNGALSSAALDAYYLVQSSFGQVLNTNVLAVYGGPNQGTTALQGLRGGEYAPYWRIKFVYSTRITTFYWSFDGITFFQFANVSAATSVFNTSPPTTFMLQTRVGANANSLVSCDWFKLTTP